MRSRKSLQAWKKWLIAVSILLVMGIVAMVLFISAFTKHFIEKNDVKYTGREISLDRARVNLFNGNIQLTSLAIRELNSDSIFFSAEAMSADLSLFKLLSKTVQINSLTLDRPRGIISQNKKQFNFSDLIERFSPDKIRDSTKDAVQLNIMNITIRDGEFLYIDQVIPIHYSIRGVNLKSEGKYWNQDTINVRFSFLPGTGSGSAAGAVMLNLRNLDYRLSVITQKLDMSILEQYLHDIVRDANFSANIDMDLNAQGSIHNKANIIARGGVIIHDLHLGNSRNEDIATFEKLEVGIQELDSRARKYHFDSIMLKGPFFEYDRYDYLDNLQRVFGVKGQKIMAARNNPERFNLIIILARYLKVIFKNFLTSDYNINTIRINEGVFQFNDYAINEKFSATIKPISITADSVDHRKKWVNGSLKSQIKPFGSIIASASMNPKDNTDFNLTYRVQNLSAASLNPYLITYTSFPLDRGVVEVSGKWQVRNDIIKSTNHLIILDPRVTERIRKKDTRWIPMPLLLSLILERGNIIDYQIPVTGNMQDPKFHWGDVIGDLFGNIFFRAPHAPYKMQVKHIESKTEKSLSLKWAMLQVKLSETEVLFVKNIADFLKENPAAKINVHPFYYVEKEKEYSLFFEAKKKFILAGRKKKEGALTGTDSLRIDKMNPKDPSFVKYLDNHARDTSIFTIQEKCYRLVDSAVVRRKFIQLMKNREREFMSYFKENGTEKQVKMYASLDVIPFNGFSYFKIDYKGEIPPALLEAYDRLIEMNDEPARVKYLQYQSASTDSLPQTNNPR